ncbi:MULTISPECIES: CHASE domain-containing protein [unclassified Vibrio]|uniref:histidine kinase n=1 Tax=Vibrio sp. HB236076 TaxID=3232307 RepID=A0AB39HK55_9VIBR|nr:CHASE domain-containing protein [Vibrio sp. HB161653]MDP5253232.1 CHASE domain-containing protein [Vibrio sp. HB161653]
MTHHSLNHTLSARLNWYHWLVIALSLLLTLFAWNIAKQQAKEKNQAQFDYQAQQIVSLIEERMEKYEEALWAGVAAIHMQNGPVELETWQTFTDAFQIGERFPGINGMGVIHHVPNTKRDAYLRWRQAQSPHFTIHPTHSHRDYWPISFIQPSTENHKALGLDMAHETNRFTAAQKAQHSGLPQITGPIVLVQDSLKTPGFLFFVPWYENTHPAPPYYGDDKGFMGLVYAPFVVARLMNGTLENKNRQVHISIFDGDEQLYSEMDFTADNVDKDPLFSQQIMVNMYGREWQLTIQSSKLFKRQNVQSQPDYILYGGLTIDALLLIIFYVLVRTNKRAMRYAEEMTESLQHRQSMLEKAQQKLQLRNLELEEANRDLDQFAFAVSHDLKAPLIHIAELSQWLERDVTQTNSVQNLDYVHLINSKVKALEGLLNGLFRYSRVHYDEGDIQAYHIDQQLDVMLEQLPLSNQFKVEKDLQVTCFDTLISPLNLVLKCLLDNAIQHHDKPYGQIKITVSQHKEQFLFTIEDDGPGVPVEHQARVFDLFYKAQQPTKDHSAGMGLAIVKKILDRYSCQYGFDCHDGRGSRFSFTWPNSNEMKKWREIGYNHRKLQSN